MRGLQRRGRGHCRRQAPGRGSRPRLTLRKQREPGTALPVPGGARSRMGSLVFMSAIPRLLPCGCPEHLAALWPRSNVSPGIAKRQRLQSQR